MSTLRNQVQLIGNVGQEPTLTTLESGKKVWTCNKKLDFKLSDYAASF